MLEKTPRKNIVIPEEIYSAFQHEIDTMRENDPFAATRPLKYKVGEKVWVPQMDSREMVEVKKSESGVYLVCSNEGKCEIYLEDEIEPIN